MTFSLKICTMNHSWIGPTKTMKLIAIGTIYLGASCGDGDSARPDALVPDGGSGGGELIDVRASGYAIALVAHRDLSETEWSIAETTGPLSYQFRANGPYLVAAVCEESDAFTDQVFVTQMARTLDDTRDITVRCEHPRGPHQLTGRASPANNMIYAGGRFLEGDTFQFMLRADTYDLIAEEFDTRHVAIRRGVRVSGNTAITPIDIVAEGAAPVLTSFTTTSDVQIRITQIDLDTANSHAGPNPAFGRTCDPAAVPVLPNRILTETDRQTVWFLARPSNGVTTRVVRTFREGDSTVIAFPEPIGPVSFTQADGVAIANWTTLPDHDLVRSRVFQDTALGGVNHEASMSRSFELATQTSSISVDQTIPGLRPEWKIDLTKEYSHSVLSERRVGNDVLESSRGVRLNQPPPPPPAGSWRLDH